jgi:hypothetical protein
MDEPAPGRLEPRLGRLSALVARPVYTTPSATTATPSRQLAVSDVLWSARVRWHRPAKRAAQESEQREPRHVAGEGYDVWCA